MQISVILLGVFIIALNFKIGERVFSQLGISLMVLDLISIMAFILIVIAPINFFDTLYVSIGGFFIFTALAIYLLFTIKQKKQFYTISLAFLSLVGISFLFDMFFPFMSEQLFDYTTVIVALILGLITYAICKNLKSSFIAIFLTMPIAASIHFFIASQNNAGIMLFLGVGNFFEISVIAFAVVYLITAIRTLRLLGKHKESDVLTLTNEEVVDIKNKEGEVNENKNTV